MTVLDIGAHVGQYSLLASRAVGSTGRVIAFEPQPDIRLRLDEHLTINGCRNVSVIAKAVADALGEVWIAAGDPGDHNSGHVGIVGRTAAGAFSVECTTIDQVVEDCGVTRLDLLKVDVEGAEEAVFAGAGDALGRWHPAIVFEINGMQESADGSRTSASIEALRALGYEMFGVAAAPSRRFRLDAVSRTDDPLRLREEWYALNLVALHADGLISPQSTLSRLFGP
jgi:FkbM family methyltransferase